MQASNFYFKEQRAGMVLYALSEPQKGKKTNRG